MALLRLLILAHPDAAARAVGPVRDHVDVKASLAPTMKALASALRDASWDAVVVVPGGPVQPAEIVQCLAGYSIPLVVTGGTVPPELVSMVPLAIPHERMGSLPDRLKLRKMPASDAFVGAANAVFEAAAAANAAIPGVLETATHRQGPADERPSAPRAAASPAPARRAEAHPAPRSVAQPAAPASPSQPAPSPQPVAQPTPVVEQPVAQALSPDAPPPSAAENPAPPASPVVADPPVRPAPVEKPDAVFRDGEIANVSVDVHQMAEKLPIGLYRSSPEGRFLYANPAVARILRVQSLQELAGLDIRTDLGYPRALFEEQMTEHGAANNLTMKWTTRSGDRVWTRENARVVRDRLGRTIYYEGTIEDATAEMEAQEAVQARSRQFEAVARFAEVADLAASIEEVYFGAVNVLRDTTETDWALLVLHEDTGNRCVAWTGQLPDSIVAAFGEDEAFVAAPLPSATVLLNDVQSEAGEFLPEGMREQLLPAGIRSFAAFPLSKHGTTVGVLFSGRDVAHTYTTAERQVAEALAWHVAGHLSRHESEYEWRRSEETLRFLGDHTAHATYRVRYEEAGSVYEYIAPTIEKLTGYAPDAFAGPDDLSALLDEEEVRDQASDGGGRHVVRYRLRKHDGDHIWVDDAAYPWRDDSGQDIGTVGVLADVTEQKAFEDRRARTAEQALVRQSVLVELAQMSGDNAQAAIDRAVELACSKAGLEHASVWLANEASLACRSAFGPLGRSIAPAAPYSLSFFDALLREGGAQSAATAVDAHSDGPARARFRFDTGASAAVIAPIRRASESIGIVVFHRSEASGPMPEADIEFATAVADAVSLAVERAERTHALVDLRREADHLEVLATLSNDYALIVTEGASGERALTWATPDMERCMGFDPTAVPTADGLLALATEDSRLTVLDALSELDESGETDFEAEITTEAGASRWLRHRIRRRSDADGAHTEYHSGTDITAAKAFEREALSAQAASDHALDAANDAANDAVKRQGAFLADASHELRTPLTAIIGYADLLCEDVAESEREYVDLIASAGSRLLNTLNSVLDLSRVEAQDEVSMSRLLVGEEVSKSVRLLAPLARQRGLGLSVSADPHAAAMLDAAGLARIVNNLVGNALKFTDQGSVSVSVDVVGPEVELAVRDSGIGIPETLLPHVFEVYQRERAADGTGVPGTGLGLAITHRLVTKMGGTIDIVSSRPGGTTFTVRFPAAAGEMNPSDGGSLAQIVQDVPLFGTISDEIASDAVQTVFPVSEPSQPVSDSPPAPFLSDPVPRAESTGLAQSTSAENSPAPAPDLMSSDSAPTTSDPTDPASTAMFDFRFGTSSNDTSAPGSLQPAASSEDDVDVQAFFTTPPPPVVAPQHELVPASVPSSLRNAEEPAPVPQATAASDFGFADEPVLTQAPPAEPVMIVRAPRPTPPSAPPAAPAEDGEGGSSRPPVLVVEDNSDTRMLLERILKTTYEVTAVGDARSALLAMNQSNFRGLVLDINLGGKETGADVLRIARTLRGYDGVFAVALTAYALPGDRERLLEAGFDEYISKPFTRASLMDALAAGVQA